MKDHADKFFACTNQDMNEYYETKAANQPIDPKTLVKQQFVMNKSQAVARKYIANYFQSSQNKTLLKCEIPYANKAMQIFQLLVFMLWIVSFFHLNVTKTLTNLDFEFIAQNKFANGSADFTTSNAFYHGLTKHSQVQIDEKNMVPNEVINSLDPSVFEVTAKK